MINGKYPLFGTVMEFYIDADEDMSAPLLDEAYALALRLQKIFNIYDKDSEISRLNRERQVKGSEELSLVLNKALKLCELSGGEYDISLGRQFLQRKKGEQIKIIDGSYRDIIVKDDTIILDRPDILIDLGSIAKGYIAERIAQFFVEQGIESGYIDARGDIAVFGYEREIGVQHPREENIIKTIKVKDKGVATSGDYRQYIKEYSNSHIINQKDIISATVIAESLMDADAYATILMVCSDESRERIIKDIGLPAMTIDKHLNIKYYNGFKELLIDED